MKNDSRKYRIATVFVVLLMVFSSFALVQETSDDSEASSDSWTCTITISGTTITTKYAKNGATLSDTTPVSGNNGSASVGSWGFDNTTGYGPFGSFYAAVDISTGKIAYHLKPSDLSKALDNTPISTTGYNIMWVLPTVWMSTSGSTLTMSSEKTSGATAPAHTIDGTTYNYLAIGVYEAYDDGTKLYSYSGQTPSVGVKHADFQTHAKATGADGGKSMIWNFYQYQLYRFCSLAVMENFDSQGQIGNGISSGSKTNTGTTIDKGPYYGTTKDTTTAERLFIENAWGNVWDYVGDAYWSSGLWAGQNATQVSGTTTGLTKVYSTLISGYYGTAPYSTDLNSWGLPENYSNSWSKSAPDYIYSAGTGGALIVGGSWNDGAYGGLSCLRNGSVSGASHYGSRLAMVFDADPAATPTVTYDHSNLTTLLSDGGTAADALTQKKTITEGGTYDQLDPQGTDGEYKHVGWEVTINNVTTKYATTDTFASQESHTAKSLWAKYPVATLNHDALIALGGSTAGLDTELEITSTSVCYPDLGTVDGYTHIGWYVDGTFYSTTHAVVKDSDHTAYSAWKAPTITITFIVEDEVHSTLEVPKNSVGIVYTPKQVEGVFMGWFYDSAYENQYDATVALTEDTNLYAKGVKPLVFTSVPTANATITNIDAHGLYYFDCTDNEGRQSVLWDFGDGNTSTDPIAYNSYSEPGKYKVTLTVTNAYGETAVSQYDVVYGDVQDGSNGSPWGTIALVAVFAMIAFVILRRFI